MIAKRDYAGQTFLIGFFILLVAPIIGCKESTAAPNYPDTLKCVYFVMNYGASISFQTLKGKTQFTMDEPVIQALLESPDVSESALVKCQGNSGLENKVTLGALYALGYKLTSIKRQHLTVNNEALPLPSWDYELKLTVPNSRRCNKRSALHRMFHSAQ